MINKHIVIAAVGITGISIISAWMTGKPIGRIVFGGYVLMLVLSIADLAGGMVSTIASGIAMLALFTLILSQTGLWTLLAQALSKGPQLGTASGAAAGAIAATPPNTANPNPTTTGPH